MIALLGLLAWGTPAHAADAVVQLDPFTLAEGELPVLSGSLPGALEVSTVDVLYDGVVQGAAPCRLELAESAVRRAGGAGSCPLLWTLMLDGQQEGTITLRFDHAGRSHTVDAALPAALSVTGALDGDTIELAGSTAAWMAVPHPYEGWVLTAMDGGRATLDVDARTVVDEAGVLGFVKAGDALLAVRGAAPTPPVALASPESGRTAEPIRTELQGNIARSATSDEVEAEWCPAAAAQELVLCWDLTRGRPHLTTSSPRQVINAGTEVSVYVHHHPALGFAVSQKGKAGLDRPGVRNESGTRGDQDDVDEAEAAVAPITSPVHFAPRVAGDGTVVLEVDGARYRYELVVQKTYSGALRTGIGFAFGNAVDAAYAAETRPGSGQAEIVSTTRGDVDVELVVGFAPYLDRGGRAADGCQQLQRCFAPYVGVGIISPKSSGIEVLTSVHAGLEWEPVDTFSIAGTAAIRRVTRLADGVQVGGPVSGAPPTTEGWGVGFGLVLNVSPDFFKVASKGVL